MNLVRILKLRLKHFFISLNQSKVQNLIPIYLSIDDKFLNLKIHQLFLLICWQYTPLVQP